MRKKRKLLAASVGELNEMALQRAIADANTAKAALAAPAASMAMTPDKKERKDPKDDKEQRERLKVFAAWQAQLKTNTKTRIWTIDLGGGSLALVSTELINWAVRSLGRWSGTGFWATQNDLLQALPHILVGSLVYIGELATRKDPATGLPSATRAVISEWAKLFGNLGYHRLMMAVRSRWVEGKNATDDLRAVQAELAAVKERNRQLETKAAGKGS